MKFNKSIISFVKGISSTPTHSNDIYLYNETADERFRYVNYLGDVRTLATTDDVFETTGSVSTLGRYVEVIGNNSATTFIINHNLETEDVVVSVRDVDNKELVLTTVQIFDENRIDVLFDTAPTTDQYSVTVIGTSTDTFNASLSADFQEQIDQKLDTVVFAALSGSGGEVTQSQLNALSGDYIASSGTTLISGITLEDDGYISPSNSDLITVDSPYNASYNFMTFRENGNKLFSIRKQGTDGVNLESATQGGFAITRGSSTIFGYDQSSNVTVGRAGHGSNLSLHGDITAYDDVEIAGNLTVQGTTTTVNSEEVLFEDNILTLNNNITGAPPSFLESGIKVYRGPNDDPYYFIFKESDLTFAIGVSGISGNNMQAVATRTDLVDNNLAYWDDNDKTFKDSGIAYTDIDPVSGNFVTLDTTQEVTGDKNFSGQVSFDPNIGLENFGIGNSAFAVLDPSAGYNYAIGDYALSSNTTGSRNYALGRRALQNNTTGDYNYAIGENTLFTLQGSSTHNVGIGSFALQMLSSGADNLSIGYNAGKRIVSGDRNFFLGSYSGDGHGYVSSGDDNILLGYATGVNGTGINTLDDCIFIGSYITPISASNTTNSIAIGHNIDVTKSNQVVIGNTSQTEVIISALASMSGNLITTDNTGKLTDTGIAYTQINALDVRTINNGDTYDSTAIGTSALGNYVGGGQDGGNFALGTSAMENLTGGNHNTAIGVESFKNAEDRNNTVAIGFRAMYNGGAGIAIGYEALKSYSGGNGNIAIGNLSQTNGTGNENTTVGGGQALTTGSFNTSVGNRSLKSLSTGIHNAVFGRAGIEQNTDGSYNTIVGSNTADSLTTGNNNTIVGYQAGSTATSLTASVFIGYQAGKFETNSDRLYVSNSDTTTPLIYGEFDNSIVEINGDLIVSSLASMSGNLITTDETGKLIDTGVSYTDIGASISGDVVKKTGDTMTGSLTISAGLTVVPDESFDMATPALFVGKQTTGSGADWLAQFQNMYNGSATGVEIRNSNQQVIINGYSGVSTSYLDIGAHGRSNVRLYAFSTRFSYDDNQDFYIYGDNLQVDYLHDWETHEHTFRGDVTIHDNLTVTSISGAVGNILTTDSSGKLIDSGVTYADIGASLSGDYVNVVGDAMTGLLTLSGGLSLYPDANDNNFEIFDDSGTLVGEWGKSSGNPKFTVRDNVGTAIFSVGGGIAGISVGERLAHSNDAGTYISYTPNNITLMAGEGVKDASITIDGGNSVGNPLITLGGNAEIAGNLTVQGTTTTVNSEEVLIEDNIITLNSNMSGPPPSFLESGIKVNRGSEDPYYFIFDESELTFSVGVSGISGDHMQAVATRTDLVDSNLAYWDGNDNTFRDSGISVPITGGFVETTGDTMTGPLTIREDVSNTFPLEILNTSDNGVAFNINGGHTFLNFTGSSSNYRLQGFNTISHNSTLGVVIAGDSAKNYSSFNDVRIPADTTIDVGDFLINEGDLTVTSISGAVGNILTVDSSGKFIDTGISTEDLSGAGGEWDSAAGILSPKTTTDTLTVGAGSPTNMSYGFVDNEEAGMFLLDSSNIGFQCPSATFNGVFKLNNAGGLTSRKFTMEQIAEPDKADPDNGAIYFDSGDKKFKVSENFGTYVDLIQDLSIYAETSAISAQLDNIDNKLDTATFAALSGSGGGLEFPLLAPTLGSDSAPRYSFSGSTNTGMHANGSIALSYNGNDVFNADDSIVSITTAGHSSPAFYSDANQVSIYPLVDTTANDTLIYAFNTTVGEIALLDRVNCYSSLKFTDNTTEESPSPSAGLIYYDTTSQKLKVSENNGAYVDLVLTNGGTIDGNLAVTGDLTVSGTTTTLDSQTVLIEDNIITLNSNVSGSPLLDSGIEVERGTSTNARIVWDESDLYWTAGISGSEEQLVVASDLSGYAQITDSSNLSISGSSQVLDSLSETTADACQWLVSVKDGTNFRVSNVMATWNGSGTVVYTETSTTDIGDTSDATLSVDESGNNIRLLLTSTQQWDIKTKRTDI